MDVQTSALTKASGQDVEKGAMSVPQNIMNSVSLENASVGTSVVEKYTEKSARSRAIVEPPRPPMTVNSDADVSSMKTVILPIVETVTPDVRAAIWNSVVSNASEIVNTQDSPCECVAFYVKSADLINAGENHREVFEKISSFLLCRNWKYLFVESSHDFHIKISRKGSISQFRVTVFLDPASRQHVLDVVDLTTDRDFPGDVPNIRQELLESFAAFNPGRVFQKRRKHRTLPSFLSESDDSSYHLADSLALYCSWADSSVGEEQLLGVRSLFGLLSDNETFLRHENTVEMMKTTVLSLLSSSVFSVRELTVNLVLELCMWEEYQSAFANQSSFVRQLTEFISPVDSTDFFSRGDLIERCGEIISILCEPYPQEVCVELSHAGFSTKAAWDEFTSTFTAPHLQKVQSTLVKISEIFSPPLHEFGDSGEVTASRPSPCDEKPSSINSSNLVSTKQPIYSDLVSHLWNFVRRVPEATVSFSESENCFKLGFADGYNERFIFINIFWDSTVQDHICEVRRVTSDAVFHSLGRDVLLALRSYFATGEVDKVAAPVADSLTLEEPDFEQDHFAHVLETIEKLVTLVKSPSWDLKQEGLKGLIDLARVHIGSKRILLEQEEAVILVAEALGFALKVSDRAIKALTVFTIEAFCYFGDFADRFVLPETDIVPNLFRIVRDTNLSAGVFYRNGQMVRKAARAMMFFRLRQKDLYCQQLRDVFSLHNSQRWQALCKRIETYDPVAAKTLSGLGV